MPEEQMRPLADGEIEPGLSPPVRESTHASISRSSPGNEFLQLPSGICSGIPQGAGSDRRSHANLGGKQS